MAAKLKTASVLAFESKLSPSDALLGAGLWGNRDQSASWQPVTVKEKSVRGTISNRLKAALSSDAAKLDAETQKPNLQTVDIAALPFDCDTLTLSFTLRVLGDLSTPSTCNSPDYQAALADIINRYIDKHGFSELAIRYATNIANARFLWRNRVGAESVEVRVSCGSEQWLFDGLAHSLRDPHQSGQELSALANHIERGFLGREYTLIKVEAFSRLGQGQTVFPSQELVLDAAKGSKSKYLYQLDGVAAMHSQKIGNALRTIDSWHPYADDIGPIAVEPYGSVTNRGKAYRQPKADFYSILDNWVLKNKEPEIEQQHYVMAMLIRGGVFGESGK